MLASLRVVPVVLGIGIGGLIATVLSLLFWGILTWVGFEDAPLAGLTAAILVGLGSAGYAAGRMSPHTHRFHGSVAGLAMSAAVFFIALMGGSPATIGQILLFLGLGIVLGGTGGVIGGRRR